MCLRGEGSAVNIQISRKWVDRSFVTFRMWRMKLVIRQGLRGKIDLLISLADKGLNDGGFELSDPIIFGVQPPKTWSQLGLEISFLSLEEHLSVLESTFQIVRLLRMTCIPHFPPSNHAKLHFGIKNLAWPPSNRSAALGPSRTVTSSPIYTIGSTPKATIWAIVQVNALQSALYPCGNSTCSCHSWDMMSREHDRYGLKGWRGAKDIVALKLIKLPLKRQQGCTYSKVVCSDQVCKSTALPPAPGWILDPQVWWKVRIISRLSQTRA